MLAFSRASRSLGLVVALLDASIASQVFCGDSTGGTCNTPSSSRDDATSGNTLLQTRVGQGLKVEDPEVDPSTGAPYDPLYPSKGSAPDSDELYASEEPALDPDESDAADVPLDPDEFDAAGVPKVACPQNNICIGNVNDHGSVEITDTFHVGQYIPTWSGRTCTLGELDWACDREPTDGGAMWLKQWCCSDERSWPDWAKEMVAKDKKPEKDPNVGKCLCGAPGLFKTGTEVPGWGGRTCSKGELSWACDRPETDGGRRYLKANCCEDPNLGACLCGSPEKFQKDKEIPEWGGERKCDAGELNWACEAPESNGGRKFLKYKCCE